MRVFGVLAVFAVGFGWLGIPAHFPGLGGLLPNWVHDFLAHGLPEWLTMGQILSIPMWLGGLWLVWNALKPKASTRA